MRSSVGGSDSYLTLDLGEDGRIVIGEDVHGGPHPVGVVVPGGRKPAIHDIEGKGDYARIIREALGDAVTGEGPSG